MTLFSFSLLKPVASDFSPLLLQYREFGAPHHLGFLGWRKVFRVHHGFFLIEVNPFWYSDWYSPIVIRIPLYLQFILTIVQLINFFSSFISISSLFPLQKITLLFTIRQPGNLLHSLRTLKPVAHRRLRFEKRLNI